MVGAAATGAGLCGGGSGWPVWVLSDRLCCRDCVAIVISVACTASAPPPAVPSAVWLGCSVIGLAPAGSGSDTVDSGRRSCGRSATAGGASSSEGLEARTGCCFCCCCWRRDRPGGATTATSCAAAVPVAGSCFTMVSISPSSRLSASGWGSSKGSFLFGAPASTGVGPSGARCCFGCFGSSSPAHLGSRRGPPTRGGGTAGACGAVSAVADFVAASASACARRGGAATAGSGAAGRRAVRCGGDFEPLAGSGPDSSASKEA